MTADRRTYRFDALFQDLRYAVRLLGRTPGFTVLSVLILALGIGANTSIFSVVSAVLIKPLPFKAPDRLVFLWEDMSAGGLSDHSTVAPANYADWKARSHSFEDMALFNGLQEFSLTGAGEPVRVGGISATGNFFSVLGLTPILGRTFSPADEGPDATPVAVVSRTLWVRRFGADPELVGRNIVLNGIKHTVIGVVPPAFRYPNKNTEIYVPASFTPAELAQRNDHSLWVIARLKPGVTLGDAQAEMTSVANGMEKDYPESNKNVSVLVSPLREELARGAGLLGESDVRGALFVLLGAVTTVLLITCANVANLLLARGTARRKELAVRQALGANRGRVLRQLLTESAVLGAIGLGLGIAFSAASLGYLSRLVPGTLPNGTAPTLDWRVLAFTSAISLLTVLLFGIGPAIAAARIDFANAVKRDIGRGAGPRGVFAGNALVVGEIALTVVLLAVAGLLLRSYARLLDVRSGFSARSPAYRRHRRTITIEVPGRCEPQGLLCRRPRTSAWATGRLERRLRHESSADVSGRQSDHRRRGAAAAATQRLCTKHCQRPRREYGLPRDTRGPLNSGPTSRQPRLGRGAARRRHQRGHGAGALAGSRPRRPPIQIRLP